MTLFGINHTYFFEVVLYFFSFLIKSNNLNMASDAIVKEKSSIKYTENINLLLSFCTYSQQGYSLERQ